MKCPRCDSEHTVKHGRIHTGQAKRMGKNCRRPFVPDATKKVITLQTWELLDTRLLEKLPLAGIARVRASRRIPCRSMSTGCMRRCLARSRYAPKTGRLTIQCDEMWSFVGRQDHQPWIWLAIDERSAEMVGVSVGARDRGGAEGLWRSLPAVSRPCAVAYTDVWSAYAEIVPASRQRAVGKETGGTSKLERFNTTMRQSISRLVRQTLSCSKKLGNHVGAIWLFVHHDNASLGL